MSNKKTYQSFSGLGVDVAMNRTDDLDKLSLEHLQTKLNPRVLDIGCGAGGHTLRMAKVGTEVAAIDTHDFSKEINDLVIKSCDTACGEIKFIKGDVRNLLELIDGEKFTDAYSQRTLHYLNYQDALLLLQSLNTVVDDRLYISVMGVESDAGVEYEGISMAIENRFFNLEKTRSSKFHISQPVCLYSKSEFEKILEKSGWEVYRCWQSAFGNLKAVCGRL